MNHKKEFRRIRRLSRKFLPRHHFRKLRVVSDPVDRTIGLKYLVGSYLKVKQLDLERRGARHREVSLLLDSKLRLLPWKIRVLESSHDERDYVSVFRLIEEIEGGLK